MPPVRDVGKPGLGRIRGHFLGVRLALLLAEKPGLSSPSKPGSLFRFPRDRPRFLPVRLHRRKRPPFFRLLRSERRDVESKLRFRESTFFDRAFDRNIVQLGEIINRPVV